MQMTAESKELQDPVSNENMKDIVGNIKQNDPLLAAGLLLKANSAYYGFTGKCDSLESAVIIVGLQEVRNEEGDYRKMSNEDYRNWLVKSFNGTFNRICYCKAGEVIKYYLGLDDESYTAPKKILVVDDELNITTIISAALRQDCNVVVENDARNVYTRVRNENPQLVILDGNMPHITGYALCRKLKGNPSTNLPVIIATADPEGYNKAVNAGADAYIEKPFNLKYLREEVKKLLENDK